MPGLEAKETEELQKKLDAYKSNLPAEKQQAIVDFAKELKQYQDEPSPQEDLEKIPMLKREDIRRKTLPLTNEELSVENVTVLHQNLFTAGINYINLLFDAEQLPDDLVPYLGLLKHVLGYVDTENYSYGELFNEINCHTGGVSSTVNLYGDIREPEKFHTRFEIRTKVLVENTDFAFAMIREIVSRTKLDDDKRLHEILSQVKSRLHMYLTSSGHSAAAIRAMAKFSRSAKMYYRMSGVAFFQTIDALEKDFDGQKETIKKNLRAVMEYVLRPEHLVVSCTSRKNGLEAVKAEIPALKAVLFTEKLPEYDISEKKEEEALKEGIKIPSAVQYVARAGHIGYYTGAYRILKVILSYDYLWIQVRVKGGAYGCMSGFGRYGDSYLVSYRDPNLQKTNEVFEHTPEYVENFEAGERDMTKYIIGAISEMDTPLTPSAEGNRSMSAWITHMTEEDYQSVRNQVLDAQPEDIRALAGGIRELLKEGSFCVIGNESRLEKDKELFDQVKSL